MLLLFIILSILFVIEASTSLARLAGYFLKFPEGGLVLQSSLSLFSRMLMFIFMPYLGYLADDDNLYNELWEIFLDFLIVPFFLIAMYVFRSFFLDNYLMLIMSVKNTGGFFDFSQKFRSFSFEFKRRKIKPLKKFYLLVFLAYIPYYMAWPLVIFFMKEFNEYRATILGLSSLFNGINTIILTVFVDPKLVSFGRRVRLLPQIYNDLVLIRVYSCFTSVLITLMVMLPFF